MKYIFRGNSGHLLHEKAESFLGMREDMAVEERSEFGSRKKHELIYTVQELHRASMVKMKSLNLTVI